MNIPPRRITGTFAFSPLELATWLLLASLIFFVALIHHSANPFADASTESWRMNLNSAPMEELMRLPGMTSRRAKALVSAREKRGGFERVSDVASVPGITSGYLRRIETMIDVKK